MCANGIWAKPNQIKEGRTDENYEVQSFTLKKFGIRTIEIFSKYKSFHWKKCKLQQRTPQMLDFILQNSGRNGLVWWCLILLMYVMFIWVVIDTVNKNISHTYKSKLV